MKKIVAIIVVVLGLFACTDQWEQHFNGFQETANQSMWDAIKKQSKYSEFVRLVEEFHLDSVFQKEESFTVFIPTNEALGTLNTESGDVKTILQYHFLDYVLNTINISSSRLIQTSTGKFTTIEFVNGSYNYNGVPINYSSPLYKNGNFYELAEVAYPKPNLYEYISQNTSILKEYIDSYDSILLDLNNSKPLGFNGQGQVIYDSIYQVVNYFDSLYYAVNTEDRFKGATFILFDDNQYENALDKMAQNIGNGIETASDIPKVWQNQVLIPKMINIGLFPKLLQYDELGPGKLKNVSGDSVLVDISNIDPDSKFLCSNGIVYKYQNFEIPEEFYKGELRMEGEHMVDSVGLGIYVWKPEIKVWGTSNAVSVNPSVSKSIGAENDSLVSIQFPDQPFYGEFNVEFNFRNVFPQKYLLVWGANFRPSGLYQFFVNDKLVREFDTFTLRSYVWKSDFSDMYFPQNGNNRFDAFVDNITEYGNVKITVKYVGTGGTSSIKPTNGFNIDFVSLIPIE